MSDEKTVTIKFIECRVCGVQMIGEHCIAGDMCDSCYRDPHRVRNENE